MNLKKTGVSLSILLPKDLYQKVKDEAEKKSISIGSLIRMILSEKYYD